MSSVRPATIRPTSWVRPPALLFTAVFERLPLTAKPPEIPAPRFAAPRPISSRFGSISRLFPLGIDLRGPEALRKTDEHHSQGCSHQSPEAVEADVGETQRRQAGVDRADDRHPVGAEVEELNCADSQDHGRQRPWDRRRHSRKPEQHREGPHPDQKREAVGLVDIDQEVPDPLEEVAAAGLDSEQLRYLADDDRQRQADDETLEHGLGDEVREEPEPQEAGDQRGEPDADRERSRRRDELVSVARDGVPDNRSRKGRGGGGWPGDQLARTAESRVENQRGRHRVETDDG